MPESEATATTECTGCGSTMELAAAGAERGVRCRTCGQTSLVTVFPAAYEAPRAAHAELIVEASEASCFYHAGKRAHSACDSCGRFVCRLCEIELGNQKLCPSCVESGQRKGKLKLESHRILYDSIALATVTLSHLLLWPVLLAAPAGLYMAARYWRRPMSLAPRTRIRLVLTVLVALGDFALIAALVILIRRTAPK